MSDSAQTPDPDYVIPTIEVSVLDISRLAGLLIGAQEYLEALTRVAMYESRPRPRCYRDLRLARDVLVQNVVDPDACICPDVGEARMAHCPVHDP